MRPGTTALALLACLGCATAVAARAAETSGTEGLAARAERAAELCRTGDDAGARTELRALLKALESELGADHSAAQIVRLYLPSAAKPSSGAKRDEPPLDRRLKRSLRKLAECAKAGGEPELVPKSSWQQSLDEARKLLNRGRYRLALQAVEKAQKSMGDDAPAEAHMRLYETRSLTHLQLGHRAQALVAAEAAGEIARKQGVVSLRITIARLMAQVGDLERASAMLDELAPAAKSGADRAELEEARGFLALRLGSPRAALAHLERARAGHAVAFGADHPSTAAVYHLQGDANRLAGEFPAAIVAYREALRLRHTRLGANHPETARTQNSIGVLQADLGDWTGADGAFGAALASLWLA